MFQDKLNRVLNAMKDAGLEQMIVADPASIYYLTGRMILPGERMLVLYLNQNGDHKLILSKLFPQEEKLEWMSSILMMWRTVWKSLRDMWKKEKKVGVDKIWPAKFLLRLMELEAGSAFVNASLYWTIFGRSMMQMRFVK